MLCSSQVRATTIFCGLTKYCEWTSFRCPGSNSLTRLMCMRSICEEIGFPLQKLIGALKAHLSSFTAFWPSAISFRSMCSRVALACTASA